MREQSSSEEEVTRDLGGRPSAAPPDDLVDGAPLDVLGAIEQPVVMHDGMRVVWGNAAARHLVDRPVPATWPGGLVEMACAPVIVDARARVLCVLAAPPPTHGVDIELLNRSEVLALASGGLAHDLGSPLSAMTAHLATLARGLLGTSPDESVLDQCRGAVLALDEVTEYMARLVRDFGRQTHAAGATGPARVKKVATQVLRILRTQLASRATVELSGSEDPQAAISAEALSRILANLLINAAGAFGNPGAPHKNRIVVAIAQEGGAVFVDVVDNAAGIPDEQMPRLFEPFAPSRTGGAGIGLAVARALARRAGGDLAVESTGPTGTRLRCRLRPAR